MPCARLDGIKLTLIYPKRRTHTMKTLDQIQNALFAAYDMRNAMNSKIKALPTENDTLGESLEQIIEFLEHLEVANEQVD